MGALKVVFLSAAVFIIIAGVSGCSRYEEKAYTGKSSGDLAVNFSLTIRNFGEDYVEYDLRLQPAANADLLESLRKKWHDEAKLKLAAYEKMQRFCEINYVEAVCKNIGEMKKDIEKPEINLIYSVKLYDKDKKALGDFQKSVVYRFDDQTQGQQEFLKIQFRLPRAAFDKITSAELYATL